MNIKNLLIPTLIILLSVCLYVVYRQHQDKVKLNSTIELLANSNSSYINEITSLKDLKKENEELYNMLKHYQASSATEVITKFIYYSDTVYINKVEDTNDSTYQFQEPNYDLAINALKLNYYQLNILHMDTIRIFDNTILSSNSDIVNSVRYQRKKWYDNFSIGIQTGIGYGITTKKPDVYVGIGVAFKIH